MTEKKSPLRALIDVFVEVEEIEPIDEDVEPMVVVLCNCSPGESHVLARTLVQEQLAACVNVIRGVTSYYVWQGNFEEEEEHTLLIKTAADRYPAMKRKLAALHSYSNPEIVVLAVADVASDYLRWVNEQTRGGQ